MGALRILCLSTVSADRICLPPFQQRVSEKKPEAGSLLSYKREIEIIYQKFL